MRMNTMGGVSKPASMPGTGERPMCVILLAGSIAVLLASVFFVACTSREKNREAEYLMRIGQRKITLNDYNKALEFAKTAYPHNVMQRPDVAANIRLRLLNQLTEELVLMARADELNIHVTDAELNAAIDNIKKDYPDKTFEEAFLENAVSYDAWKRRLGIRLLMEKLIATELADTIKISQKDIEAYYETHYQDDAADLLSESDAANAAVIESIRRSKAESAYKDWIKRVRNMYHIEVNKSLWKKIAGAAQMPAEQLQGNNADESQKQ